MKRKKNTQKDRCEAAIYRYMLKCTLFNMK